MGAGSMDSLAPLAVTAMVGALITNHRTMTPTNNPPTTMCPAFFVSARFQNFRGAGASAAGRNLESSRASHAPVTCG